MPTATTSSPAPSARVRQRALTLVLTVGIIDGILLLVLLYVAFVNRNEGAISVLGPIHGLGYVYLLYLTATGAMRRLWGWWFPALVLVTAGPLGTIIGEMKLRREG
jgi:Kef-type K+ transport system membrane component KefB